MFGSRTSEERYQEGYDHGAQSAENWNGYADTSEWMDQEYAKGFRRGYSDMRWLMQQEGVLNPTLKTFVKNALSYGPMPAIQ